MSLRVRPFAALRPRPDVAARVASVPYDVVDAEEARALVEREPLSFLRVVRSEVDLPAGTNPYDDAVYAAARGRLEAMLAQGVLQREDQPAVYLYRQEMELGGRRLSQTGVVACCHVDDYRAGLIKKHELTRKAKEDDRTRHVLTLNANTGPVFLLHRDEPGLAAQVERDSAAAPLYDFTAPDGVRHTVWRVADSAPYVQGFAALPAAYVADGHHRSASAARAGVERAAANPQHTGEEEYNWFLSVLFPASALTVLPYHRVVRGLGAHTPDSFRQALAALGELAPAPRPEPDAPGRFGVYLAGSWYRLTLPEGSIDRGDPVGSLDCALLGERVLGPLLGIGDVRTDPRVDFVGGIRGTAELAKRVDEGRADVAFAMHPTTVEQLIAVADAGQIMPPKSTWFEPKLRSGLLIHTLD